jgi:hypothetical protein
MTKSLFYKAKRVKMGLLRGLTMQLLIANFKLSMVLKIIRNTLPSREERLASVKIKVTQPSIRIAPVALQFARASSLRLRLIRSRKMTRMEADYQIRDFLEQVISKILRGKSLSSRQSIKMLKRARKSLRKDTR